MPDSIFPPNEPIAVPAVTIAHPNISGTRPPQETANEGARLFPLHVLPTWVRDYVSEVARATSSSVDLGGVLVLPTLGSCLVRKVVVQVARRYKEPVTLWTAVFAPVSEAKSPVLSLLSDPIIRRERELVAAWEVKKEKIASERRILERTRKRLENEAARFEDDAGRAPLLAQAQALSTRIASLQEGIQPQLIADDFTVEALVRILAEQDGRIALLSDEGAGLFGSILRRAGRGLENFDALLKAHSGTALRVNRARGRTIVHDPALSLALGLQPDTARLLRASAAFRGRGLLARFLWARAPSLMGLRPAFGGEINREVEGSYSYAVEKMLNVPVPPADRSPLPLTLTMGARERYAGFADTIEPQLRPGQPLHLMSDWVTKQVRSGTLRVAGLLHCLHEFGTDADNLTSFEIEEQIMGDAIELISYFMDQSTSFFEGLDRAVDNVDVERLLAWMHRREDTPFSRNEATRALQSLGGRRVEAALQVLVEQRMLVELPPPPGQVGRPAARYARPSPA